MTKTKKKILAKETKKKSDFEDDPYHYLIKSVDPKHNVFNRKMIRKAKRKGVKDIEKFLADKEQEKKAKKEAKYAKKKPQAAPKPKKDIDEPKPLENYYDKEADQSYLQHMIEADEKEIKFYERRLGMGKDGSQGSKRFLKEMTRDGWDADMWDFLGDITKKVQTGQNSDYSKHPDPTNQKNSNKKNQEDDDEEAIDDDEEINSDEVGDDDDEIDDGEEEDGEEGEEGDFGDEGEDGELGAEFEDDYVDELLDGMEDDEFFNLKDEGDYEDDLDEEEKKNVVKSKKSTKTKEEKPAKKAPEEKKEAKTENPQQKPKKKVLFDEHLYGQDETKLDEASKRVDRKKLVEETLTVEQRLDLEKALRGCVNRVAEGNIESILNKMTEIYTQNSKYVVNELYSELFMKSCVDQPHVLHMILATNSCLITALYQLLEDDFVADFVRKLIVSLRENVKNDQRLKENEGFDAYDYKLKNTVTVLCFLYNFDVFHEEFLGDLVVYLADNLNDRTINHIMSIIQHSGFKIRQTSPGSLKLIIDYTKKKYEEYKIAHADHAEVSKKMEIMFLNLNDLKHNKKMASESQDRLEFLSNWLKKAVTNKHHIAKARFPAKFGDMIDKDLDLPRWWAPVKLFDNRIDQEREFKRDVMNGKSNEYVKKLEALAVEQRFNSDIRKKIFMVIMSAEDYLDAAQKILKLEINKKQYQEIAVVIVETCAQEEKFNKYYVYLAEHLIRVKQNIKFSFQYAVWDHFKLLENYSLRKIANLAKFLSSLVAKRVIGLQVLRALDFEALNKHHEIYLKVFFKNFYENFDDKAFKELVRVLNENEEFALFRDGLKGYLKDNFLKSIKDNRDKEENSELLIQKVKLSLAVIRSI